MKQARIENGLVVETAPPQAEFEPGFMIPCPDDVDLDWHYDGATFTPPTAEEVAARQVEELAYARQDAIPRIDQAAEEARGVHLTPGDGQMMVYEAKVREAIRYTHADAAARKRGDWPYLNAEKTALAAGTLTAAAQRIIARRQAVDQALAAIEAARLSAKRKIAQAATPQAVEKIVESLRFPPPGN